MATTLAAAAAVGRAALGGKSNLTNFVRVSHRAHHQHKHYLSSWAKTPQDEMNRLATIRLYRILQRTCRSFPVKSDDDPILLQPALEAPNWGRHAIFVPSSPTVTEELYRLFYILNEEADDASAFSPASIDDWYYEVVGKTDHYEVLPPLTSTTCWTTRKQLADAIRTVFRIRYDSMDAQNLLKWSIRAVQMLQEQQRMWSTSSVATTEQIRVTATSRCIGTTSPTAALPPSVVPGMLDCKYRFAYRVRVENLSEQYVQLLGRYWHIQETTDDMKEDESRPPVVVDAPVTGAVGHLPVLKPGQVFEYMSGTDLATPKGIMKGHFYMARVSENAKSAKSGDDIEAIRLQDPLEVVVAPFPLMVE